MPFVQWELQEAPDNFAAADVALFLTASDLSFVLLSWELKTAISDPLLTYLHTYLIALMKLQNSKLM